MKIVGLLFTVAEKWGLVFNTPPKESFNDDILKSCKYLLMVQKRKNHFWGNLYLFVNIFCYDHRYMSWIQVTDLKFMDDITHSYVYKHSNKYLRHKDSSKPHENFLQAIKLSWFTESLQLLTNQKVLSHLQSKL